MTISTKGRYALRVMTDLAQHAEGEYLPLKDVAARQGISLKYLERILPMLAKSGLIEGVHGKGGGYRLTRPPEEYTLWEILCLAEGEMAPVACLEERAAPCPRAAGCPTLPVWQEFYEMCRRYFSGITLSDLMKKGAEKNI